MPLCCRYFGIEVGYQCYCGNAIGKNAAAKPESECNSRCTGEASNPPAN